MKEKILEFQKNVESKFKKFRRSKNQSFIYFGATSIIILGMVFFLTSNRIFNQDFFVKSTVLNQEILFENNNIKILDREYNPNTGVFEMFLNIKNSNPNIDKPINISLKEKNHLDENISCELIKVGIDEYVIYSELPLDWSAVSISVTSSEGENSLSEVLKIYSDRKDTKENNNLKNENVNGYKVKFIDLEIESLNSNISEIDKLLEEKNTTESNLKKINSELEEDKKYQTENEKQESDSKINSNKSSIEKINKEKEELNNEKKELQNKISKINQKKNDLEKHV
ncbi:TPA: hypothetical protein I9092_000733 [Clostridium perfringens]|uniref:Uncharacterized protein n=1 Tax=Clostridium perfringens TaxID=1502 RepID=A0AB37C6B1_CLOPF|nr:hypothetical protein [Clostridium perfringens]AQW27823.1 hypothetical protein BXT94_13895 [Clostridium perfringens]ASY52509.1 hypothetical protein BG908_12805 [Clostridium perfringens]AWS27041.1 hypothetical protein CYK96_15805 [Clostridium perfringens]MBO3423096.1 hypothetical protein [Clostridium perfringens]MBO3437102.1 hypothetical protein [Clostridium perfringens]